MSLPFFVFARVYSLRPNIQGPPQDVKMGSSFGVFARLD
jgi:hypothetical protein